MPVLWQGAFDYTVSERGRASIARLRQVPAIGERGRAIAKGLSPVGCILGRNASS